MELTERVEILEKRLKSVERQFEELFKITHSEPEITKKLKVKYSSEDVLNLDSIEKITDRSQELVE